MNLFELHSNPASLETWKDRFKIPEYCYEYCVVHGECMELEPVIATSARYSYLYAKNVIGGRFEKGEDAIATDAYYSYLYALHIIDGRFEKGEKAIASVKLYKGLYTELLKKQGLGGI